MNRPPIKEAILDFVFSDAEIDRQGLQQLADTYERGRWKQRTLAMARLEAEYTEIDKKIVSTSNSAFQGFSLTELEGPRIVQFREDRVTVSHVGAYGTWEDLEADSSVAFGRFVGAASPVALKRIGARFINRIPMHDDDSFERLLTIPPQTIAELGSAKVTDFVRRQIISGLDMGFTGLLTVATVAPTPEESTNAILVDVDVFKEGAFSIVFDELRQQLATMRKIKNAVFFGSLTESALEPFT